METALNLSYQLASDLIWKEKYLTNRVKFFTEKLNNAQPLQIDALTMKLRAATLSLNTFKNNNEITLRFAKEMIKDSILD